MFKNYLKMAIKVLLRRKFFTFVSLFGISFTLLILMVIVSLVDNSIGQRPPENKLRRTLSVLHITLRSESGGHMMGPLLSHYCMTKYIKSLKTPQSVSVATFFNPIIVYKDDRKLNLNIKFVDAEFWDILDFEFIEGRPFGPKEVENISQVAVINEDTRRRYFHGEAALGKTIEADGKHYRVIGVVENVPLLRALPYSDIWVPITNTKEDLNAMTVMAGTFPGFHAMILARDRSDFRAIQTELRRNFEQFDFLDSPYNYIHVNAETYAELISRAFFMSDESNIPRLMIVLFMLMVLFILLPTINLVNINVSRIMERGSEIGVRKSFGASSLTLIGQFIVENVILTLIGGAIAFILTLVVLDIINGSGFIKYTHLTVNYKIFVVSLGICLFFGLFSGVYPAYRMSRMKPAAALRGGESW
jgi:putative ABC transport system permease protein